MSLCGWRRCCEQRSNCCDRKVLYYEMILEEEESVLQDILIKDAKEQLTDKINGKIGEQKWDQCFDAAADLIKDKTTPRRPAAEQVNNHYPSLSSASGFLAALLVQHVKINCC